MTNENLESYEYDERFLTDRLLRTIKTIEDYYFTSGRVCFDCEIICKNEKKILSEVKVRHFKLDKYPDYILQVSKLISLIKKAKKKKSNFIYYINFFYSETAETRDYIIFNLTPRIQKWKINKPKIERLWMNDQTFLSTKIKVCKEVIMLKYDSVTDAKGTILLN